MLETEGILLVGWDSWEDVSKTCLMLRKYCWSAGTAQRMCRKHVQRCGNIVGPLGQLRRCVENMFNAGEILSERLGQLRGCVENMFDAEEILLVHWDS
jgi:hypothetical protein